MTGKQRSYLRQYAAIAIFALAYLALGFAVRNSYYQLMMTLVLIWATMGLGWNMLSGYSGMISFGHAAFFGLGAYTVTIAFVKFGITAIAGGLFAMSQSFQPYIGFDFVIVMYAGVVLGGMGSILGAFWGGLTIGLVQQMSTLVLPYQLQNTAIFVVFLIIIFFRPQGMFGRVWERT